MSEEVPIIEFKQKDIVHVLLYRDNSEIKLVPCVVHGMQLDLRKNRYSYLVESIDRSINWKPIVSGSLIQESKYFLVETGFTEDELVSIRKYLKSVGN